MHGILSFARFGVNKFESAERTKLQTYFQRIESSGKTLLKLLNDLLDLSKLEAGCVELEYKAVDLALLIAGVGDEFIALAREKNLTFRLPPEGSNVFTWGDGERLAQVLRNVIGNGFEVLSPKW